MVFRILAAYTAYGAEGGRSQYGLESLIQIATNTTGDGNSKFTVPGFVNQNYPLYLPDLTIPPPIHMHFPHPPPSLTSPPTNRSQYNAKVQVPSSRREEYEKLKNQIICDIKELKPHTDFVNKYIQIIQQICKGIKYMTDVELRKMLQIIEDKQNDFLPLRARIYYENIEGWMKLKLKQDGVLVTPITKTKNYIQKKYDYIIKKIKERVPY